MDPITALILCVVCLLLAAALFGGDLADWFFCQWDGWKHRRRQKHMARAIDEARLHAAVPRPSLDRQVQRGPRVPGLHVVQRGVRGVGDQPKDAA
jgi:hypothetical protein